MGILRGLCFPKIGNLHFQVLKSVPNVCSKKKNLSNILNESAFEVQNTSLLTTVSHITF